MTTTTERPRVHTSCLTRHRTYRAAAGCAWPRAAWVTGEGPHAVLASCRVLTVTLHPSAEAATDALAFIDHHGCGGRCIRNHRHVVLAGLRAGPTFAAWLRAQRRRDDAVGDLARDVARDADYRVSTPGDLFAHIDSWGAAPEVLDTVLRAEAEWLAVAR